MRTHQADLPSRAAMIDPNEAPVLCQDRTERRSGLGHDWRKVG